MFKEIGGYIQLDTYNGEMLYDDAILLNCGRNALLYLIKTKNIRTLYVPKFMCNSNDKILKNESINCIYYSIDLHFRPIINKREKDEWLYLVNYYGQLSNDYIKSLGKNIIVDNAQAYFQPPIKGYDTIYACRKYFGVADGAILYTDKYLEGLEEDESYKRMNFLLGRYERNASEFYKEYVINNEHFFEEPLKKMSKLTRNLLHAIDYDYVKKRRTENFTYLHKQLRNINELDLIVPDGTFMYPLYLKDGENIRKKLIQDKIYIPILWPDVFNTCTETDLEYNFAKNILPLPIDQRYDIEDMKRIVKKLFDLIED